jgi:hypothetical protein
MKTKLLLLIILGCVSSLCTQAQDNTGKKLVALSFGGTTSFSNSAPFYSNNSHNYSVGVLLGKYASKTKMKYWSIFTTFGGYYTAANNNNTTDDTFRNESFGIGLSKGNEYYKPIFGKLSLYGGISGGFNVGFGDYKYYNDDIKGNSSSVRVDLGGSAGVIYAINSKWQLQGTFLDLNLFDATYKWSTTTNKVIPASSTTPLESTQTSFQYDLIPTLNLTYGLSVRYLF